MLLIHLCSCEGALQKTRVVVSDTERFNIGIFLGKYTQNVILSKKRNLFIYYQFCIKGVITRFFRAVKSINL